LKKAEYVIRLVSSDWALRMHTIHGLDEIGGAFNKSVTSIGGAKWESLTAVRVPLSRFFSSGGVGISGAADCETEEQPPRPRHSKSSTTRRIERPVWLGVLACQLQSTDIAGFNFLINSQGWSSRN
jgi:hypothetical protein